MSRLISSLGFLLGAFGATACGYTEIHEAVLRTPGPPAARTEIYLADTPPPRAFYEVALVQVYGYGSEATLEDMGRALEARGRALGCDALVRVRFELGRALGHGYGVCVRWSENGQGMVQTAGAAAPPGAPVGVPSPAAPPADATK